MTETYAVSLKDGTEVNIAVSDEPWRGDVNVTDWEAVTEGLLLRVACRKCGRPTPITGAGRLFLCELSMKDLPALRTFPLPAKENRYFGGDRERLKDEVFLRRYVETQYVFFDYGPWALLQRDRELREARFLRSIGSSSEGPPELGYTLRPEARGRGCVVEARLAALRYAKTELGFATAKIRVVPEDRAGCAVAAEIEGQWNYAGGAPQCHPFAERESSVYKGRARVPGMRNGVSTRELA